MGFWSLKVHSQGHISTNRVIPSILSQVVVPTGKQTNLWGQTHLNHDFPLLDPYRLVFISWCQMHEVQLQNWRLVHFSSPTLGRLWQFPWVWHSAHCQHTHLSRTSSNTYTLAQGFQDFSTRNKILSHRCCRNSYQQ